MLSVAPEHAAARQLLASLLAERNEFADAEVLLIGLLRDYPEDAGLYGRYSRLMLRTLHLDKAEQLAREGLRYDPDDNECLLALALCETARGGARANEGLQKLIAGHPESMSTVHALVVALVDGGRIDEAHRIAQQAMRADPANEHLVSMVRELRIQNHWSLKPLWPLRKWGWGASAAMWIGSHRRLAWAPEHRARTLWPGRADIARVRDLQLGMAATHQAHPVTHRDPRLAELEVQLLRDPLNAPARLEYARLLLAVDDEPAALQQYEVARKLGGTPLLEEFEALRAPPPAVPATR